MQYRTFSNSAISPGLVNLETYVRMIDVTTCHSVSVMATATRRRIRYQSVACLCECDKRNIRCVDCGRWTHIDCVSFCERVETELAWMLCRFVLELQGIVLLLSKQDRFRCDSSRKLRPNFAVFDAR